MNYKHLPAVKDARYYAALNLLRAAVDGSDASDKKVNKAFRVVMTHAHKDRGGSNEWSAQVNAAKTCLVDVKAREQYNAALDRFGLPDGKQLVPDFTDKIAKKINPAAPVAEEPDAQRQFSFY